MKKSIFYIICGLFIFTLFGCKYMFKKKQVLNIVGLNITSEQEEIIAAFQKKYPEIEVEVTDYAKDNDINTALQRLNADIMGKNAGDILISNTLIPLDQYIEKGVLWNLMEADGFGDVNKSILPSVLKACETDGEIYSIFSDFSIFCFAGKRDVLSDDKWNIEAVSKVLNELADKDCNVFSSKSKDVCEHMLVAMMSEDIKENSCITKIQEFIDFMESSKKMIELSEDAPVIEPWDIQPYQSGEIPVSIEFIDGFNSFYYLKKVKYAGEDILIKGYPVPGSEPLFDTNMELSVLESSKQKEWAWKFISHLLSEEYQDSYYKEGKYAFSVNKNIFEKQYKASLSGVEPDEDGEMIDIDYLYDINGKEVDVGIPTSEDFKILLDTIDSMNSVRKFNSVIEKIVSEKMNKYMAGSEPAQQYIDNIKYETELYLEEMK